MKILCYCGSCNTQFIFSLEKTRRKLMCNKCGNFSYLDVQEY